MSMSNSTINAHSVHVHVHFRVNFQVHVQIHIHFMLDGQRTWKWTRAQTWTKHGHQQVHGQKYCLSIFVKAPVLKKNFVSNASSLKVAKIVTKLLELAQKI